MAGLSRNRHTPTFKIIITQKKHLVYNLKLDLFSELVGVIDFEENVTKVNTNAFLFPFWSSPI